MGELRGNYIQAGEMKEESVKYFLAGLKAHIKASKLTQEKFAEGISTAQYFSKLLNSKATLTNDILTKIQNKLDIDVADIVLLGKQAEKHDDNEEFSRPSLPPTERRDSVTSLTELIKTFRKQEEQLTFWQSCLEGIPIPICIIGRESEVIFQNQADRSLYKMNVVGEKLCPACRDNKEIPHPCADCAIDKVLQVGEPAEKHFHLGGRRYKLIANPVRTAKGDFVVVVALEA